ncbi:MAG: hypothetical protein KJ718_02750 [Nanoarchaeota archaeon]|nr:hypothetical protein [Nanoarchaeota archaeon]MBU1051449.1 hypothetical protein [Nanoarchaeota archaeon]
MVKKYKLNNGVMLLSLALALVFFLSLSFVSATNCYLYTSNATGQCDSPNGCIWRSDPWGSWCEELNCWSLWTQDDCTTTSIANKNCTWRGGGTQYYCEEISCWTWDGTSEAICVNNTDDRSCEWRDECFSSGGGNADCWGIGNNQSLCQNTTGCAWGGCMTKSCWDYTSEGEDICNAKKDPWNGRNCVWSNTSSSCIEDSCWSYELYNNITTCNAASHCNWIGSSSTGWCEEIGCWSFDGNQTGCINSNTTDNLDCTWNSGYCIEDNCWTATDSATCGNRTQCIWDSWETSGWCDEVNCWTWDSWSGGSEEACNGNASLYGLSCNWVNMSGGIGWCETDFSNTNCSSYTNEMQCYDSWYCWWQANDWSDPSVGGNCTDPDWSTVDDSGSILNQWNPGCYIFDNNMTECGYVIGCDNSTGVCDTNSTHAYNLSINANGINCTIINSSSLCNSIPALSSCCAWQSGTCTVSEFDASCWSNVDGTPSGEDSCDDATTKSNCDLLAGTPWYWPCKWDNSTSPTKCTIKTSDIWGNNTQSLVTIENKKTCEAIGGKWITENYCAGNISVPTGRCEHKFDDETNCNKACFACESKSDGSAHNSTDAAREACYASLLGFCEFTEDSNATNGYGKCRAKTEFTTGVAETCGTANCGACTFMGDPSGANGTKTPESWCKDYPTACKWEDDNSTTTGGYCLGKDAETCKDACDRCETQSTCTNDGRTNVANQSGSCKWQGGDSDGSCVANIAGDVEICWNGEDDDSDSLIDCADPGCYADSFCGMVSGDCFVWNTEDTCNVDSNCEWVSDGWGSWCDFRGSQCWRYDGSETTCRSITQVNESLNITLARSLIGNQINEVYTLTLAYPGAGWVNGSVNITNVTGGLLIGNYTVDYTRQTINFTNSSVMVDMIWNYTNVSYQYYKNESQFCEWQAGSGSGWCEQDWSIAEVCFGYSSESGCNNQSGSGCAWSNDTWCSTGGNGTDWCDNYGGWCDHSSFVMQDCWQYSSNSSCNVTGCSWRTDEWSQPHCEVNWTDSMDCWGYGSSNCTAANGCWWNSNNNWCGSLYDECWNVWTESECDSASVECTWQTYGGGDGNCQPACFNETMSNSGTACEAVSGCVWMADPGWCEEQQSATCWNSTNSNNQTNCDADSVCRWRNDGWCNPKDGFNTGAMAGGGGIGGECWRYDGNQSYCTNSTIINISCSWFSESSPWCEVDWNAGGDCWQYASDADGCNVTNGCWFKSDDWGSYCTNIMDQCWSNTTLQTDASACNNNSYCNSTTWGSCEPTCFSATTQATCGSGCRWLTGWCNPTGMMGMFDEMETGAPTPIGIDGCGTESISQASVDICGFGMKDMGDTYGFGTRVYNFENSSVCNRIKISSFVMDMEGGGGGEEGGPTALEKTGDGNETVKYIVYLDTDGSIVDGCAIESLSGSEGYEFKLRYSSVWDNNNSKATETFTSYKCDNSKWKVADIKTNSWKQKMCNEIGGPMIAIEKGELSRFPTLYSSTGDMRVYVVTIGDTGDITTPTDSAGPAWATPGAVDFELTGALEFGANTAKFEKILQKGFVGYEDCYNGVDDDENGAVDCADWACEFNTYCVANSLGTNNGSFGDTTMPVIKGVRVEEYPDAALLMFESSKPVNGTLKFYGNDSTCKTLNKSVYDVGIRKNNTVREFKLWQQIALYDDGATSLVTALDASTDYYYKLRICDSNNKCSLSKCSKFRTTTTSTCGYCNFVLRLKEPSAWNVSYDADSDGTYEHSQGQVCGVNAGMKINYTDARAMNIKLSRNDGTIYFEFLNVSVSKTGLNDKVRTLTTADDNIIGTSTLVGLNSESRDKIINNLHPEVCRIKVPFTGTCDTLYHCNDAGTSCTDRTSSATLKDATNCVWEVPFCEFSTYYEFTAGADGGVIGGGSSGGGGLVELCGNGIINTGEECDDGNTEDGDGCSSICEDEEEEGEEEGTGPVTGRAADEGEAAGEGEGLLGLGKTGGTILFVVLGVVVIAAIVVGIYFGIRKRKGY